jgi:hypothetical protein
VKQNPWTSFDPEGLQEVMFGTLPPYLEPAVKVGTETSTEVPKTIQGGANDGGPILKGGNLKLSPPAPLTGDSQNTNKGTQEQTQPGSVSAKKNNEENSKKVLIIYDKFPAGSEQSSQLNLFVKNWNRVID